MSSKKRLLQYICTGVLCFFSIFTAASAGLAWFYCYKQVNGNDADISARLVDLHASYFVYKYNKSNIGTDEDDSSQEAIDEHRKLSITGFTLNTYDTIFINQNQYTPALIRIHVYGKDVEDASIGNEKQIKITIERDTDFVNSDPEITDENLFKCITSVANFTVATPTAAQYQNYFTSDIDSIDNVEDFLSETVTSFKSNDLDHGITFFTEEEVDGDIVTSKLQEIELIATYNSTIKIDNVNHIMIYLYIDYNLDLLENFTNNSPSSLGGNFLGQVDTVLENDIKGIDVCLAGE